MGAARATLSTKLDAYPALGALAAACLRNWPDHHQFLSKTFDHPDPIFMRHRDGLAAKICELIGPDIDRFCDDYRWTCAQLKEEQFFFHRNGRYRLRTLAEAVARVYGVPAYMRRYVNGLLLSQIFWQNHAYAFYLYCSDFLPNNSVGYDHLEIGPGHGLFTAFSAEDPNCRSVAVWDVSPSSLQATAVSLKRLGISSQIAMIEKDVVTAHPTPNAFDSVVMSELLEHLEDPTRALGVVYDSMRPGARIYLNVPVNSPAPDHLFLWREPEEVIQLVRNAGFDIEESWQIPMTGQTLQTARRLRLDISCVVIGRKPMQLGRTSFCSPKLQGGVLPLA
jgi:SAM-dependent methyltransferase